MKKNIIVMSTIDSKELAIRIADELLNNKIAACINILPGVLSRYWWQGSIESDEEYILLIKTSETLFSTVSQMIKQLHSYECPEIISLPIIAGSEEYLSWLNSTLSQPKKPIQDQS